MSLSPKQIQHIDMVFEKAHSAGRGVLYEFEVYDILNQIGLDVPRYVFVETSEEVNEKLLQGFPQGIVIKIVSAEIIHKQKLGGVKKIDILDPLFIRFVMEQMKNEVLSHFDDDRKPKINGFLIVEYIAHTQALGYETLIGVKEDMAFGPVVTLSKGGDDAEFFAAHYDPANLFLPPLDHEAAGEMVKGLNIRHKFQDIDHPEYLDFFAKAVSAMGDLAFYYSFTSPMPPSFVLKALDVNPFVITPDNHYIAIDGFAEFEPYSENRFVQNAIRTENLDGFFKPKAIAVVGVSSDLSRYSLGRDVARLLHDTGRESLFFINPKGGSLKLDDKEYVLYQSLSETGTHVDLIVYAAPAGTIVDFMKTLSDAPPRAIILIPGIPVDVQYEEFIRRMDQVRPPETRIIGPNCMGVFVAPGTGRAGVNTLFMEQERLEVRYSERSNVVLLTQSGAFSVTAIDRSQYSRIFRAIVSFGNQFDVKITDLIEYFSKIDTIEVISLYLEGLDPGEGRLLFQQAQRIRKPMIVYKSGKTDAGAKAAASHTASMSGSYEVFSAACTQSGIILVEHIEEHYNMVKIFSLLTDRIPSSNRVAGVVNAGFESTVGADELKNLRQARLNDTTIKRLNQINAFGLVDTCTPFLDLSPMADDMMYANYVETILLDENVDCVFVAIVPHTISIKTSPDTCHDADGLANLLVELNKKHRKPVVISVNAGQYYQEFISILESAGLPVYGDIRSAIRSLDAFVSYHLRGA